MDLKLSKKTILYFLVFLWLFFSTGYVIWNVWQNFQNIQLFSAYEQGRVDTIEFLIQEAEKCQPVPVFSEEKQIQLIDMACLETKTESIMD